MSGSLMVCIEEVRVFAGPDMAVLLTLQTAFSNWDIYQRTQGLNWTSPATMCTGWQGVQCNTAGSVIGLNFSAPTPDPPQRLRALEGVTNMTVHSSEPIALQGFSLTSRYLWLAWLHSRGAAFSGVGIPDLAGQTA